MFQIKDKSSDKMTIQHIVDYANKIINNDDRHKVYSQVSIIHNHSKDENDYDEMPTEKKEFVSNNYQLGFFAEIFKAPL